MSYIPQSDSGLEEPRECAGCERQGPFQINHDQSNFVDSQTAVVRDLPAALPSGELPQSINVRLEDDLTGALPGGSTVRVTGVLCRRRCEETFELYLDAVSVDTSLDSAPADSPELSTTTRSLSEFVDAAAVAVTGLPDDVREEETKAKLITPLIEALGWNKFDNSEVRLEYTDSKTSLRPDYALFGAGSTTPDVVVEANSAGSRLEESEDQLCNYVRVFSAAYGLLTDGRAFHIYSDTDGGEGPVKRAEVEIESLPDSDAIAELNRDQFRS